MIGLQKLKALGCNIAAVDISHGCMESGCNKLMEESEVLEALSTLDRVANYKDAAPKATASAGCTLDSLASQMRGASP